MTEPRVADTKPAVLDLQPGAYYWCACGHSVTQPFCDGSHKGTGLRSLKFEVTETATLALCQCKQSGTKPFCDGSHGQLQ